MHSNNFTQILRYDKISTDRIQVDDIPGDKISAGFDKIPAKVNKIPGYKLG